MRRKMLFFLVVLSLSCLVTAQFDGRYQPADQSNNQQPIIPSTEPSNNQSNDQSSSQSNLGIWWSPVVNTTSGLYQGYTYDSINYYMGIPYAEPPVGPLRFSQPKKLSVNHSNDEPVHRAYFHGNICPQMIAGSVWLGHEDCLFLNVYAPVQSTEQSVEESNDQAINHSTNNSTKLKPVFVWIYGGSFVFGDSYEFGLYEATNMVKTNDIVVVTFNYRLGPLGFMALDSLSKRDPNGATGNAGLADQRLALQWVHDNIVQFGGDPSRVTIGGESAGAMSTCSQLAHQLHVMEQTNDPVERSHKQLFHGIIMQSGTCDSSTFWPDRKSSVDWSVYYASMLGCSFNQSTTQSDDQSNSQLEDSDRLLDCLRSLPVDVFVKSSKSKNVENQSTNQSTKLRSASSSPSDYDDLEILKKRFSYSPRSNDQATLEDVVQWHAEQVDETINHSVKQSIKQSVNESDKLSVNPPPLPILYPTVPWTPVIDGVFLTDTPLSMIQSIYQSNKQSVDQSNNRPVQPVPVLIGTNLDEGTLFIRQLYQILPDDLHDPLIESDLPLIYQHVFGDQSINQTIKEIDQHYPPSNYKSINHVVEALLRDYIFACPSRRLLNTIYQSVGPSVNQSSQSTWLYEYRYNPGWIDNRYLGVYHSAELEFVWSNQWPPLVHTFNADSWSVARLINEKWGSFIKHGHVNGEINKSINQSNATSVFWPAWDPHVKTNLVIDHPPSIEHDLLCDVCDFWDSIDQSINHSIKQVKQKKLQQAYKSIKQTIDQSIDQLVQPVEKVVPRVILASE